MGSDLQGVGARRIDNDRPCTVPTWSPAMTEPRSDGYGLFTPLQLARMLTLQ